MAGNRCLAATDTLNSLSPTHGCLIGTQKKPQQALSMHTDPLTAQSVCVALFISAFCVVGASSVRTTSCVKAVW